VVRFHVRAQGRDGRCQAEITQAVKTDDAGARTRIGEASSEVCFELPFRACLRAGWREEARYGQCAVTIVDERERAVRGGLGKDQPMRAARELGALVPPFAEAVPKGHIDQARRGGAPIPTLHLELNDAGLSEAGQADAGPALHHHAAENRWGRVDYAGKIDGRRVDLQARVQTWRCGDTEQENAGRRLVHANSLTADKLESMTYLLLLRHSLAILAYRTLRAVHRAPEGFAAFRAGENSRTAGAILAHMGDLIDWGARHVNGDGKWIEVPAGEWEADQERFFVAVTNFDLALKARGEAVEADLASRLLQGPIADALSHAGQINLLRGLAGSPVGGENYYVADIVPGRTTMIQPPPRRTF